MIIIVGALIVIGCVFGGYMLEGGYLGALLVPAEFLIIAGAAWARW